MQTSLQTVAVIIQQTAGHFELFQSKLSLPKPLTF